MDEPSFRTFESFDFEGNQHFQTGWRAIERLIDPRKKESEYLRAQAFYFTKNVQSFDYEQYLLWRHRKQLEQVSSGLPVNEDSGPEEVPVNDLSLAEVAELIQNNQPIPGAVSVHVEPSNAEPTPSKLMRKMKPWETAGSVSAARETADSVSTAQESADSDSKAWETAHIGSSESESPQSHSGEDLSHHIL
ncbi:hypothetical protein BsWGS_19619 [Bradybaena similaris]